MHKSIKYFSQRKRILSNNIKQFNVRLENENKNFLLLFNRKWKFCRDKKNTLLIT